MKAKARGFTLLELLVVIVVIGILASLALPRMVKVLEKARTAEAKENLGALRSAEGRYHDEHSAISTACHELDTDDPGCTGPGDGANAPTTRYYDYLIETTDPAHCPTDATSTYWITATRVATHNRPDQPAGVLPKPYHITLSSEGNLCDDIQ